MSEIDLSQPGPLDRPTALAALARAQELLDAGQLPEAAALFHRVIGFPEPEITATAFLGMGTAFFRMDRDAEALSAWEHATQLPENPKTYEAWKQIAGVHVRAGDLAAARDAYKRAERLAPASERPEIATRLGWLAKESGDTRGANRAFSRGRAIEGPPIVTYGIIGITVLVSLFVLYADPTGDIGNLLYLDKPALANGEYWRLLTPLLVHVSLIHLAFNMYALWFSGQIVERLYGRGLYITIYLLAGAAGSIGSFLIGGDAPSAGASGAIFGLFGILFAAERAHHPMLDRRSQAVLGQIGMLIAINLAIGFFVQGIDIWAHIGGLVAGLWLGFLIVPGGVPTLAGMWQRGGGGPIATTGSRESAQQVFRIVAIAVLVVAIAAGLFIGTVMRTARSNPLGRGSASLPGPAPTLMAVSERASSGAE